jgi:hypothetical protein
VSGKSLEYSSVVHICIIDNQSLLRFKMPQVHRIEWILRAPTSQMLALISKSAIYALIGGSFKATYLKLNKMYLKILTQLKDPRHVHGCN